MNIKNWISDFKYNLEHSKNAKRLNSELEKRYYKPKSNSIIKILSELDEKAGLSPYDVVPFLIKIDLMSLKGSMIEKGCNGKIITDRERNTELFSELEQLEFIRIIENKLYSFHNDTRFPTPTKECVLRVKLLPKGIDYLTEHNKRKDDKFFKILSMVLLGLTIILSLPQACNGVLEYFNKNDTIYKVDIVNKDCETKTQEQQNTSNNQKDSFKNGISKDEPIPKPLSETTKH